MSLSLTIAIWASALISTALLRLILRRLAYSRPSPFSNDTANDPHLDDILGPYLPVLTTTIIVAVTFIAGYSERKLF